MNHAPIVSATDTCQAAAVEVPVPTIPRGRSRDRIHAALVRRIDGCAERRTAAALAPGDSGALATWTRERDRGDRLRRALISHLKEGTEP